MTAMASEWAPNDNKFRIVIDIEAMERDHDPEEDYPITPKSISILYHKLLRSARLRKFGMRRYHNPVKLRKESEARGKRARRRLRLIARRRREKKTGIKEYDRKYFY
jgi:hypothetical protein